jgi:hypothetical protein
MTLFEFLGQFFFCYDVFKLQEVFSEDGIRVYIESGLGNNSYFTDFRQTRDDKKIPKTVLKTRLKIKETAGTFNS